MSHLRAFRLLLLTLIVLPACGGGSPVADGAGGAGSGSGGAVSGVGGTSASGGNATTGGATATGGSATGGQLASGGAPASGGAGPGSGGSAASGWEEIRCWRYQQTTTFFCYGRIGNLWANVWHVCTKDGDAKNPMTRTQMECGGADDPTGWDETWCNADAYCYGRLGDWGTDLVAACETPMGEGEPTGQTPAEARCDAVVEAPAGWENVDCYDQGITPPVSLCYGFRGIYYPFWGLYPACDIDDTEDPDLTEVVPEDASCN